MTVREVIETLMRYPMNAEVVKSYVEKPNVMREWRVEEEPELYYDEADKKVYL